MAVAGLIDVNDVSSTQPRMATMNQSSLVRRSFPPRQKNVNAHAPMPTIAQARMTNTFAMSNWSYVSGSDQNTPNDDPLKIAAIQFAFVMASGTRKIRTCRLTHTTLSVVSISDHGEAPGFAAVRGAVVSEATFTGGFAAVPRSCDFFLPATRASGSPGAAACEDHAHGIEKYLDVHEQVLMIQVNQVVLELALRRGGVAATDLSEARHARLHAVALAVPRYLLQVPFHEERALRARPHEAHLAAQDVDQLRELVDAVLPHEAAQRRDPRVVVAGEHGTGQLLGVLDHAAELHEGERLHVAPEAFLAQQNRRTHRHEDEHGEDEHHGAEHHEHHERQRHIERSFGHRVCPTVRT